MKTWVRKTLSVGVLAAGALLFAPGAAHADVSQDSSDNNGVLNGTQLFAPVSIPVNLVGNAIGVAGEANAAGAGSNWTEGGKGGVSQDSSDNNGVLNGTQAYLPFYAPINIVGNAAALLGEANAAGAGTNGKKTESARTESGRVDQDSDDNNGILNGTQVYAPVDVPINFCGNSLALLGEANAQALCANGRHGESGWAVSQDSSDNNGVLNGTQVYAPISAPLNIAGNAIGVAGEGNAAAAATNESGRSTKFSQDTSDNNGIANGTQIAAPIHLPINVCGNALSILGEASASAACSNGGGSHAGDNGDQDGDNDGDYPGNGGQHPGDHPGDVDADGGDDTPYGSQSRDQGGRTAQSKAATEATALDGVSQSLTNAGGLNVGGLDVLNTLR
jgi:hypothetical protein